MANRDLETEGLKDRVVGKAKEIGGKILGDEGLEAEGKTQNIGGKVEEKLGQVKHKVDRFLNGNKS